MPDHPLPPDRGRNTVYERRKVDPAFPRGRRVGTIREYDNRLLQFQLRALQPEIYGQGGDRRGRWRTRRTRTESKTRWCLFWRA